VQAFGESEEELVSDLLEHRVAHIALMPAANYSCCWIREARRPSLYEDEILSFLRRMKLLHVALQIPFEAGEVVEEDVFAHLTLPMFPFACSQMLAPHSS
jgi:hypothetical protein